MKVEYDTYYQVESPFGNPYSVIQNRNDFEVISRTELQYKYIDQATNHSSETQYEMLILKKINNMHS